jgi:glycosyltransferase involved in cell wall biosynthesis
MNTVLIAHNYSQESFASMSYELAHSLVREGNRVVFISHRPFFEQMQKIIGYDDKLLVFSWPTRKRPTTFKDVIWFVKLYLKYKPSTIIGHFVGSNISVLISKILSFGKAKTFVYYHTLSGANQLDLKNSLFKQKMLSLRKRVFYTLFCDLIICPSRMSKIDLKKVFNITKSEVVLNSIIDRYKGGNIITKDKIVISYLGRLDPTKGVVELTEAFLHYKTLFPASKISLQIAGKGSLEKKLKELGNEIDDLVFLGELEYKNIDDYLSNSHFTIIPSLFDNLPTVGLESLMNATPLLISNNTGLTEYLEEGEACLKFDVHLNAIVELFKTIEDNEEGINKMRLHARASFINLFSMQKYCKTISNIIN